MQHADKSVGSVRTADSRSKSRRIGDRSQDQSQELHALSQLLQIGNLVGRLHVVNSQSLAKNDAAVINPDDFDPAFPRRPLTAEPLLEPSRSSKSTASRLFSAALTVTLGSASSPLLYPLVNVRRHAFLTWTQSWHHTLKCLQHQMRQHLLIYPMNSAMSCGARVFSHHKFHAY